MLAAPGKLSKEKGSEPPARSVTPGCKVQSSVLFAYGNSPGDSVAWVGPV